MILRTVKTEDELLTFAISNDLSERVYRVHTHVNGNEIPTVELSYLGFGRALYDSADSNTPAITASSFEVVGGMSRAKEHHKAVCDKLSEAIL